MFFQNKGQGNFWRKEVLLLVSTMPAGVNFISAMLIGLMYDLTIAGIWFIGKSTCQLLAAAQPGLLAATLIIHEDEENNKRLLSSAIILTFLWFALLSPAATIILQSLVGGLEFATYFFFYWLALVFYTISALIGRYYSLAIVLLKASILDACISVLSLLLLFYVSFESFLLCNSVKYLLKGLLIIISSRKNLNFQVRPNAFLSDAIKLLKEGGGIAFKGWLATFSQYGDKVVIGAFVSHELMGVYGVGSTVALPIVMLASTITLWSMPYIKAKNEAGILKGEKFYTVTFIALLLFPLIAGIGLNIYGFSGTNLGISILACIIVIGLTIISLLSNIAIVNYNSWKMFFVNSIAIIFVYFSIGLTNFITHKIEFSLLSATLVTLIASFFISKYFIRQLDKWIRIYCIFYLGYAAGVFLWIL